MLSIAANSASIVPERYSEWLPHTLCQVPEVRSSRRG